MRRFLLTIPLGVDRFTLAAGKLGFGSSALHPVVLCGIHGRVMRNRLLPKHGSAAEGVRMAGVKEVAPSPEQYVAAFRKLRGMTDTQFRGGTRSDLNGARIFVKDF